MNNRKSMATVNVKQLALTSLAQWNSRREELVAELDTVRQSLADRQQQRRLVSGRAALYGTCAEDAESPAEAEREGMLAVEALETAIALADEEITRLTAAEEVARLEAQRQRRLEIVGEIKAGAAVIDGILAELSERSCVFEQLFHDYAHEGGRWPRRPRFHITIAALHAGLRPSLMLDVVAQRHLWKSLADQFETFGNESAPEENTTEVAED